VDWRERGNARDYQAQRRLCLRSRYSAKQSSEIRFATLKFGYVRSRELTVDALSFTVDPLSFIGRSPVSLHRNAIADEKSIVFRTFAATEFKAQISLEWSVSFLFMYETPPSIIRRWRT